jgi:UDP-N-acetylmuramoyl-tripeptide--D-alanyl-D-alanine ligase
MLELGKEAAKSHLKLGRSVAKYHVDRLYLLGQQAVQVRRGALLAGMDAKRVMIGKNHSSIARLLHHHVKKADWILFKGSRGMAMEKVLAAFKDMGE